jgi:hypothetical protein
MFDWSPSCTSPLLLLSSSAALTQAKHLSLHQNSIMSVHGPGTGNFRTAFEYDRHAWKENLERRVFEYLYRVIEILISYYGPNRPIDPGISSW